METRKVIERATLLVVFLVLIAALFWFAVSHEDARAALKEVCAFVQRQSVEHAKDPPQELLDAIHACWKEGLQPKAVTKEPKTLRRNTVCANFGPCSWQLLPGRRRV